jgi:hypothetical protein
MQLGNSTRFNYYFYISKYLHRCAGQSYICGHFLKSQDNIIYFLIYLLLDWVQ